MEKVIIEIQDIKRKEITKKNGEKSTVVEIVDGRSRRAGSTWDVEWTKNWKIGDNVEIAWGQSKTWTDRSGAAHETWSILSPDEKPRAWGGNRGGSGAGMSTQAQALLIASTLLAPHFAGKKIELEYVSELAERVKPLLEVAPPAQPAEAPAAAPAAPAAPAPAPEPTPAPAAPVAPLEVNDEEEDDKPF